MHFEFFLGGHDLEMEAIGTLLALSRAGDVHDRRLPWGARASAYADLLQPDHLGGRVPVLVELAVDVDLPVEWCVDWLQRRRGASGQSPPTALLVDHHGVHAGREVPTALRQVFDLLDLPEELWTRRFQLIAANDRAHIAGLAEAGATDDEIVFIRQEDRRAQGVTCEEENAAVDAIRRRTEDLGGDLTVIQLPTTRTSAAVDRMDRRLGGPGYRNLLCISPGELNFFGAGEAVRRLNRAIPGGWCGGNLSPGEPSTDRGFWGITTVDGTACVAAVREVLATVLPMRSG